MTREEIVRIAAGTAHMEGVLALPAAPIGVVLFAHGSGSGRLSPRNNFVAARLREAGIGTLLLDLLTADEDRVYENRFDIALLTGRLGAAAAWLATEPLTAPLRLGLFGASNGDDGVVVDLNRQALATLSCDKRLEIVPGATHLFEEPGKLEEVAACASAWFVRHLGGV